MTTNRKLAAVIFDMDGTLLDTSTSVPQAVASTVHELTGREISFDDVYAVWEAGTVEGTLGPFLDRPVTTSDRDTYLRQVDAALTELRPYPGIPEAVQQLAERLPLAVYTGASRRSAELALRHSGLADHLPVLIGGDDVRSAKPHPEGIHRACRQLSVSAASCAYVGDAPTDMLAAKAGGTLAVAAGWGRLYDPSAPCDLAAPSPADLVRLLTPPSGATPADR